MQRSARPGVLARKAGILLAQADSISRQEGLTPLVRRASALLFKEFFRCEKYYMFEHPVENVTNLNDADFVPRVNGCDFREVSTAEEADEMASISSACQWRTFNWRERVDNGAIAFCTLADGELAHVLWVATSEKAQECMGQLRFKVDFSSGEYCSRSWTNPAYRRQGLARYTLLKATRSLRARGMTRSRYVVLASNAASLATYAPFKPSKCGEARYLRFFGWKTWREKLSHSSEEAALMDGSRVRVREATVEELGNWDRFVQESPCGTIFHSLKWANLLQEVCEVEFIPLVIELEGEVKGIMPLYAQGSVVRRLMSPPSFAATKYGGWLLKHPSETESVAIADQVLTYIRRIGRSRRALWTTVTLPPYSVPPSCPNCGYRVRQGSTYIVDLTPDIDDIWRNLDGKRRNNVRKALKENVVVEETEEKSDLKRHIDMVSATFSRQGLVPPSLLVQQRAWELLGDYVQLFVARFEAGTIGSMTVLRFGKKACGWTAEHDEAHRQKYATSLLFWHALEWAKNDGMEEFDLMGAGVPRIARFKKAFGGRLVEYPVIEMSGPLASMILSLYRWRGHRSIAGTRIARRI